MNAVARWAAGHGRSLLFLVALLAVGGLASALKLPVALFPHVDFPRVEVSIEAGDQPAQQMAVTITRPLEQAVRAVRGVRSVRSTTSRGSAQLSINFKWGADMVSALLQTESAINQALPSLPSDTSFSIRRMDPTVFPVAAYSLTSDKLDLVALQDLATYQLTPLLSAVDGVAKVAVLGGKQAEYQVLVDPDRLYAYGLSLADITRAVSAANVLNAVGRMQDFGKLYLLLSDTRLKSIDDIRHTIIRTGSNGVVRLSDIARVEATTRPNWTRVTADGQRAVLFQVYQTPGANTVQIVNDVKAKLAAYHDQLPAGVKIANWYDQSELIVASAASVRDAILIGIVLAALTLLIFLRNLRITLIALLVVPSVLASTVILLTLLGMSFNIMTLGGMAAAVGLIVDDAIVMVEHIVRRLQESDGEHHRIVKAAATQFTRPLMASSAATIVIFLPLAFLGGVTGAFFKALSLTMAASLFISFLICWLIVPLLAARLLARGIKSGRHGSRGRLARWYAAIMTRLLRGPVWMLAVVLPLLVGGYLAYQHVGSGFIPQMDEGGFVLDYRTPPGTSLTETDWRLRQVEGLIQADPAVATYSRRTGIQLSGSLSEANEGDFFIKLKAFPRAGVQTVMARLRQRIEANIPGVEIEMALLMEDLIGDLTAVPQPIEIKLFGNDPKKLLATAPKVAAGLKKVSGVVGVSDGVVYAGDAIDIRVQRDKAALEGIDPGAITQQVNAWLKGTVTTRVQKTLKQVGVRVWVDADQRRFIEDIGHILLRAPDGHRFRLSRVAEVKRVTGQPQIARDNLKRVVAVTGRISGRDLGSTIADVKSMLAQPGLIPKGMYFKLGGLYHQQQIAFRGLAYVFAAALALVFLLILFVFERFSIALAILGMPLLASTGVFGGLWLTGINLNITAMMGLTMIIGIVTEVAIFYVSELEECQAEDTVLDEALITAGVNRTRPIAMTTIAAMLTLMPLALGLGQGAAMQQPLAVAIISGLVLQLPLVLFVMPVCLRLLIGSRY